MNNLLKLTTIFLSLIFALLTGCNSAPSEETSEENLQTDLIAITKAQFAQEKMEIGTPQTKDFRHEITVKGVIEAPVDGKSQVSALIPGIISNLLVSNGQKVIKGQTLYELDSKEAISLQQEFVESASKLKYLTTHYESSKVLFEEKILSEINFLMAESEYLSELARHNALKAKLSLIGLNPSTIEKATIYSTLKIASPISGYVTQLHCTKGQYVDSDMFLIEIIDFNRKYLKLFVFQSDLPEISAGQTVEFFLPFHNETRYNATIRLINKSFDAKNNYVICAAEIENGQALDLIIGQNVEALIAVNVHEAPGVPEEAIFKAGESDYLLVKENEDGENYFFRKTAVTTGSTFNGWVEVMEFDPAKNILLHGGYNLIVD